VRNVQELVGLLSSKLPLILDVYAEWCGPCKRIAPKVEELARTYAGSVLFARLDGDDHDNEASQQLAAALRVRAFPTFLAFEHGHNVPTERLQGANPAKLEELTRRLINSPGPVPTAAAAGAVKPVSVLTACRRKWGASWTSRGLSTRGAPCASTR